MSIETVLLIDKTIDIILLSLAMLQEVTNKPQDEILDMIKEEGEKTDELLKKLR